MIGSGAQQTGTAGTGKRTERAMLDLLHERYRRAGGVMTATRFAIAEHVSNTQFGCADPLIGRRIADMIAVDSWESTGHAIHGHEVKIARADLIAELRDPGKAAAWSRHCHHWWLVVPDSAIARGLELPESWGVMTATSGRLRVARPAARLVPQEMPPTTLAQLLRAVAKTAVARDRAGR